MGTRVGTGEALSGSALPPWQVAGLSVAMIFGPGVSHGSGTLVFGVVSVGVIWALQRLHSQAPQARTTADLIASVPGAAPARAISLIQFAAYLLIGAYMASGAAGMALVGLAQPDETLPAWSGPAMAVLVVAVTAVLVAALPTRLLAPVVTVLAGFALLVFFFVSLAVIASVASGTAPIEPQMGFGEAPPATEWGPAALLVVLAIAVTGFEIPTTASDRLRSVSRPLGGAMALVVLCAAAAWLATNMGTTGEVRYDAGDLVEINAEMFGESARMLMLAATVTQAVAAILVLVWGVTRVYRPAAARSRMPLVVTAVVLGVLTLIVSVGWLDAWARLWGVGAILLFVVYLAATHANSRLDDSSTTAWALFALMGVALFVVVFLKGVGEGWWPVLIAAVIVACAAAWAVKSGKPTASIAASSAKPATKPRPTSKAERLSRGNRTS